MIIHLRSLWKGTIMIRLKTTNMTIKLDSHEHKINDLVVVGPYQVYRILSTPRLTMYAPHWKLLYWITLLDCFKEGFLYEVERA